MEAKLNSTIDYEFANGEKVKMSLWFYALYQLKSKNPDLYRRYNETMNRLAKNNFDELDSVFILYVAYRCANIEEENFLTEEEFIMNCGCDRKQMGRAFQMLTQPKKQTGSVNHS